MSEVNWVDFFDRNGYYVATLQFYEQDSQVSVEALYQNFKARLLDEMKGEKS
jgi:hypothetical protein